MKIDLKNIVKEYQKGTRAVDDVSISADSGDFLVLVGPSGCGKSTILRMIAGLEEITSGELFFDEKKINDLEPGKRNIGMVFQNYALYPHLTVYDNLAFPLRIIKIPKKEIEARVIEIAHLTGLDELLKRKPKQLSGGQRQRVALGRALIRKPNVFLFDEPLSNLDAKLRIQMRNEIVNLHEKAGTTSVYVTHDQVEAMTMGTKIAVMNNGKIMQYGTPDEVYNRPENIFVAGFLGSPQMNFFKVRHHPLGFEIDENIINVGHEIHEDIYSFGIRPENISIVANDEDICSTVKRYEFLGYEQLIYATTGRTDFCIRQDIKRKFKAGEEIKIKLDRGALHFFDYQGIRL
ncbi:MAG: ABC transporter ATP-binding protein [Candidatus Kapabacteria bacterium]|nr:ABC transporter ATP-binding protein [Ignavibacteriota bacterium]MCW5884009.1 ABC transporter ATP-binding protein [Candidatus Kapabacteria bacterium]